MMLSFLRGLSGPGRREDAEDFDVESQISTPFSSLIKPPISSSAQWPSDTVYYPSRRRFLLYLRKSKLIEVRVGREDDYKTFFFDERLVCNSSKHLKERCLSNNEISIIHFTDQEPIAFYVYFLWVQSEKRKPIIYTPAKYSDEPWLSGGVSAWLLARQLDAPDFEKYALSQFIQNCAAMVYGPWDRIEREVSIISPLRRFSDHWVAWNHYLAGRGRGTEYSRLHAATDLAPFVTDDTRDPRIYDLEHWYEDCGDNLNPRCCHDPILRKEALEEEERLVNTDVPEWGDTFELDGRNRSCMFCHYVARPPQISTPQGTGPGAFVCAFSLIFFLLLMTLLVLSSIQVRTFANIVTGIRDTTGKWTMFTVIIGILTFLVPPIWILYAFFAFIDGIATAVDARSCFTVSLGRKTPYLAPCHQMRAISALIWLSILFGCLHLYSMLWLNAYLKRLKRKIRVRNNRGWHTRFWTEGRVEFALGYSKFSLWLLPQMVGMKSAVIRYIRKRVFKR